MDSRGWLEVYGEVTAKKGWQKVITRLHGLRSRLDELPRGRKIAAYCQVGQRGYLATRILLQAGLSVVNVGGGYKTYKLFHPSA